MCCGKRGMCGKLLHSIEKKDRICHNIASLTNLDL